MDADSGGSAYTIERDGLSLLQALYRETGSCQVQGHRLLRQVGEEAEFCLILARELDKGHPTAVERFDIRAANASAQLAEASVRS
eukprot:scaffold32945_cov23-Tisochrysis_lutea.AAC.2